MIAWIIVAVLLVIIYKQHTRNVDVKMYMSDYILLMLSEPMTYELYRHEFLQGVKQWPSDVRSKFLWLHSNSYFSSFVPNWGKKTGSPKVVAAALEDWMESEGV